MAHDFAAAAGQVVSVTQDRSARFDDVMFQLGDPWDQEVKSYKETVVFGQTTWSSKTGTGDPTPIDLDSAGATTSMGTYEQKLLFTRADWEYDVPGIVEQGAEMITQAWVTIVAAFWDSIKTASSTAHPLNSETWLTATGGGDVYYCDVYNINPPNASSFEQTNVYATALSDTAVSASLGARDNFKNFSGGPVLNANVPPWLLYAPQLATSAGNILNRPGEMAAGNNSGTPVSLSPFGGRLAGGAKIQGNTPVATDWFLWYKRMRTIYRENGESETVNNGPVVPWIRTLPEVRVSPTNGGNDMQVIGYGEWAMIVSSYILFDLIMHDV